MKPEDVLAHPALVLTDAQRTAYFADGFLILPDYVPQAWLARLRAATQEMLERSRSDLGSRFWRTRVESMSQISGLRWTDSGRVPKPRQPPKAVLRPRGLA
jgi:hypothetical protein